VESLLKKFLKKMTDKTTQTELNGNEVEENEEVLEIPCKSIENFYNATERYSMMSVSKMNHAKKLMVNNKKMKDSKLFLDEVVVSPSLKKTLSEYLDGSLENIQTFNNPNDFSKTKAKQKEPNVQDVELKVKTANKMDNLKNLNKEEITKILNQNSKKPLKNIFCKVYSKNKNFSADKKNPVKPSESENKKNSVIKSNLQKKKNSVKKVDVENKKKNSEIRSTRNRSIRKSIIKMKAKLASRSRARARTQTRTQTRTRPRTAVKKVISNSNTKDKTKRIAKPKLKLQRLRINFKIDFRKFNEWEKLQPESSIVEFETKDYPLVDIRKIFMKRLFLF
jgi:hypothetical protein